MDYVKVESSQIAEVAYDAATETLGLRFPPTKKQQAEGDPGSEYHYSGVSARTHQALMAAPSIGSYFGQNIKSRPDLYPYQKVEDTVDLFTGRPTAEVIESPVDGPGSAIAKVDTLKAESIFVPGTIDPLLIQIREEALAEVNGLNISTPKMRKQIKDTANKVVKSRTFIERLRVGYVSAEKKRLATVDAEAKRIKEILQGIEDEVRAPLTAWENAEEDRVNSRLEAIKELGNAGPYTQANWMTLSVEAMQDRLRELETDTQDWQEFSVPAQQAKAESVKLIKEAIAKRETYDREQAELAKLRAEAAAREQQERVDAAVRYGKEKAEQEAKNALEKAQKQAAWQAEIDRRKIEDAEGRARDAELAATANAEAAVEAERKRIADEAAKEVAAAEARAADKAHRDKINWEAVEALMIYSLTKFQALQVVEAVAQNHVPHVKIEY